MLQPFLAVTSPPEDNGWSVTNRWRSYSRPRFAQRQEAAADTFCAAAVDRGDEHRVVAGD